MEFLPYEMAKERIANYGYRSSSMSILLAGGGYVGHYGFFSPLQMIAGVTSDLGLNTLRLKELLIENFGVRAFRKSASDATFYVVCCVFEGDNFDVWFNTTHKGTRVETTCQSPRRFHRFLVEFLRRLNYKASGRCPEQRVLLNSDGTLPENYLYEFVVSDEDFLARMGHALRRNERE